MNKHNKPPRRKNNLSKESLRILIELYETGSRKKSVSAGLILKKAGLISKTPNVRNLTNHDFVRMYQLDPAMLIRQISDVESNIKSLFKSEGLKWTKLKRTINVDAINNFLFKFAFNSMWRIEGRSMTIEEIEALREKLGKGGIRKISELALFFWACRIGAEYGTLRKLYNKLGYKFREKTIQESV